MAYGPLSQINKYSIERGRWKVHRVPYIVQNFTNFGPETVLDRSFHPASVFYFQSITHALSGINMAPYGESKQMGLGLSAAQIRKPKKILTWQWHHIGRP